MRASDATKEHFKQMEKFDSELQTLLTKWNAELIIGLNTSSLSIEVKVQNKLTGYPITWLPVSANISLT